MLIKNGSKGYEVEVRREVFGRRRAKETGDCQIRDCQSILFTN